MEEEIADLVLLYFNIQFLETDERFGLECRQTQEYNIDASSTSFISRNNVNRRSVLTFSISETFTATLLILNSPLNDHSYLGTLLTVTPLQIDKHKSAFDHSACRRSVTKPSSSGVETVVVVPLYGRFRWLLLHCCCYSTAATIVQTAVFSHQTTRGLSLVNCALSKGAYVKFSFSNRQIASITRTIYIIHTLGP